MTTNKPELCRSQPCGCVICTCEHETQCQGCGGHHCGTHPVGQFPAPAYMQPAERQAPADYSLTPVPDELFAAEFSAWWEQHGQFCRTGGGDYERTFAFEAWRYLYPQLMKLQKAAAEQQPALTKYQPCGCVICTCEHDTQCQGCGAKHCGTHPVGQIPGPVYQQPAPDVEMRVMEALAAILRKAQGRTDTETGECIDVGAECMAIRREFDRSSKAARGLVEALEQGFPLLSDEGMDEVEHHCEWVIQRERKRVHSILAAHRKQGGGQ